MSSSLQLYAGEGSESKVEFGGVAGLERDEFGEGGRTVVGGGVNHGAGWQRVFSKAPSPHPTSRTYEKVFLHFTE